ncbi:MAG: hypothetical protein K9L78_03195, partial [Victivallales bacterium]|nr:hypothetical protein [Victivallales bacterium]
IISGINKGMNMGHDIFYSGTVAGAREALINNISGIACSKKCNWDQKEIDYSNCAEFIAETIKDLKEEIISKRILLNINFPLSDNFKGIKITHLGDRIYDDTIYYSEENGVSFVSIVGNSVTHMNNKGSDLDIINNNYTSITPLVETKESVNLMLKDKLSQIYN